MKAQQLHSFSIPRTGAVLTLLAKCFDVRIKDAKNLNNKDFERLKKGGLSKEKMQAVAHALVDEIVAIFEGQEVKLSPTVNVLEDRKINPAKYMTWQRDSQGNLLHLRDHLVHEIIEFMERNDALVETFGSGDASKPVIYRWLVMFALPFLVFNLVEYQRNGDAIEKGMPRGKFWYLPEYLLKEQKIILPMNSVMAWWQDLLGVSLDTLAVQLCNPSAKAHQADIQENAKRQVRAWMNEDRPPDLATIDRWTKESWNYTGCFEDSKEKPLTNRWAKCRSFLIEKGFDKPGRNWLNDLPENIKRRFSQKYRGEALETEILPFEEASFTEIINHPDPISAGFPVESLIQSIAERYAIPSNRQLRARLLMAAAFQRASTATVRALGPHAGILLLGWFRDLHYLFMELHNRANPETQWNMLRLLNQKYQWGNDTYDATAWLLDENWWEKLPATLHAYFMEDQQRPSNRPAG